jgi:RNA polymerase sigma factor (sigma-70 family)
VHGLCARLTASADAEDLAQETFLRVLRFGADFRGDARFDTWLYRVARNVCVRHLQRAARERSTRERWSIDARVDGDLDASMRDGDDRASVVTAGMARLAPAHREVLVLCRLEGLPFEEVGAILGCTAGAARVRAHRALRALRELCIERARHG